ncbi:MAG: HesA/MoeB/ThiF family protein [Deltaproteobacteria bacterium]|nr:HesA/MoeB/ThiF family protein [Deltaproteobacteria bacterium]
MITDKERKRYIRQIPMIGEAGQERLKSARVLVAGAGGLGTVISLYLAAAGVGCLRIVDCDAVEPSNLNRQILHWSGDIGRPKTASIEEKLAALNPLIRIETVSGRITEESIEKMVRSCDLIVDAMDNFPTRYLLNRTAVAKGIPFIHGAVRGFFGQATTVIPGKTPCLRCIFPGGISPQEVPIVGATCGVIGSIEATEAIKLLAGLGEPLSGRLFLWDGLALSADSVTVERDPSCPVCGIRKGG